MHTYRNRDVWIKQKAFKLLFVMNKNVYKLSYKVKWARTFVVAVQCVQKFVARGRNLLAGLSSF